MAQTCHQISEDQHFRCYSCPAVPAVPFQPAGFAQLLQLGWDTAARSQDTISGDCYTEFTVDIAAGAACGLGRRLVTTDPAGIAHGFLFEVVNGLVLWTPIEFGERLAAPQPAPPGALWRVQRYRNSVAWLIDGVPQLVRPSRLDWLVIVIGCLYSSADEIG